MMETMIKEDTQRFVEYAKGRYDKKKTVKAQNACYDKMIRLAKKMVKDGTIEELRELLTHQNAEVRCSVATILLPFAQEEAQKVLEELATQKGAMVYWEAKMTLEEYNKGTLKFPHCVAGN